MSSPHYSLRDQTYDGHLQDEGHAIMDDNQMETHAMKLKVLYTFDKDFQATCLARWPEVIHVRTLTNDDGIRIGVISLETCIQAVAAASPEILGKEKNDFMIYAFDYSEEDVPLVGQGKLSTVLTSAHRVNHQMLDDPAIVTGRVAVNKLSVFSKAATEILEVKLRLVPIPASVQGEVSRPINVRGTLRRTMSASIDTRHRHSSPPTPTFAPEVRHHSSVAQSDHYMSSAPSPYAMSNTDLAAASSFFNDADASLNHNIFDSAPNRVEGQTPGGTSGRGERTSISRPVSRSSQREQPLRSAPISQPAFSPAFDSLADPSDTGRARKRAKVMPTQWNTDDLYGLNQERLRIAASEAASVRDLRRYQIQAGQSVGSPAAVDEPDRPPTPRPQQMSSTRSPVVQPRQSRLRESTSQDQPPESDNDADYSDVWQSIESRGPSPKYRDMQSAPTTPLESASSPAVKDNESAFATSPMQPGEHPTGPLHPLKPAIPQHPAARNTRTKVMSSAVLEPLTNYANRGRHIAPLPANEQRPVPRPQTTKSSGAVRRPRSSSAADLPRRSAAEKAARRKQLIKERLVVAVGSGEVPEYCSHCGSIETPSWRKAWIKEVPELNYRMEMHDEYKDPPIYEDVMDPLTDVAQGTKVIIKSLPYKAWSEPGFDEVMLCNRKLNAKEVSEDRADRLDIACGIYLHKHRSMRPGSCWSKAAEPKPRRLRGAGSRRSSFSQLPPDGPVNSATRNNSSLMQQTNSEDQTNDTDPIILSPPMLSHDIAELQQALALLESPRSRRTLREDEPQPLALNHMTGPIDERYMVEDQQSSNRIDVDQTEDTPMRGTDNPIAERPRTPNLDEPSFIPIYRTPQKRTPKRDHLTPTPFRGLFSPAMKNILFPSTPTSRPPAGDEPHPGEETPFTKQLNQYLSEIGYSPNNPQPLDNLPGNAFAADSDMFSLPGQAAFSGSQADLAVTDFTMPSSPPLPPSMLASSWDTLFDDDGGGEDERAAAEREGQSSPTPRGKRAWPDAFEGIEDEDADGDGDGGGDGEGGAVQRVYPNVQETLLQEGQKRRRMGEAMAMATMEPANGQAAVVV